MTGLRGVGFVFCCLAFAIVTARGAEERPDRRNLLVILTDEHHFRTLGCYGGEVIETPHIDWIAKHGARCTSFYATTPVCSPSRAALVSGKYPQKTPVVTNNIPLDDSVITFAEILRRQGYATGYAGKWHLDGAGKPQWAPSRKFGFEDNRFMFNRGHWKKLVDTPEGPRVGPRGKGGRPTYDVAGADEKTFTTDWLCTKAIDFIETNRDQPFCYTVSLPDPHGPNTVRAPYDTMYERIDIPIPASLNRKPGQIPGWGRPAGVSAAQLRKIMPKYYGMVKCIDDNVGRMLDAVRHRQMLEKTIVVFTSDHGDLCGEHGRLNKGVPYEGSARVPFLIYNPGTIKPGTVVEEALTSVDFLPTVMAMMEIPVEHPVDGRDATPLFSGNSESWDDIAIVRSTPGRPWLCAITKQYKLTYSSEDDPWLVDVRQDPSELTNLFVRPAYEKVTRKLTSKLLEYCRSHHDEHGRVPRIQENMMAVLKKPR